MKRTKRTAKPKKVRIGQDATVRAFAARLRELRRARGLSQFELAEKAHTNASYLGELERAESAPGIDLAGRLAEALEVAPAEMFPLTSPEPTEMIREQLEKLFAEFLRRADAAALQGAAQLLPLVLDGLSKRTR